MGSLYTRVWVGIYSFMLLIASVQIGNATIVDVYVYNTEFSIYPPGESIVAATITQGDTIRWIWVQGGHTTTAVTGSSEQWDQPLNSSNTEFLRQFNNVGVFVYYCQPHGTDNGDGTASGMASTITVLAAGSGACCLPAGDCITTSESGCIAQNGSFAGVGSSCDTMTCDVALELIATKDNILYESITGALSNALGSYLYAGNSNGGKRRTVLAFDLSAVPDHAEMDSVMLKLYCNSSSGSAFPVTIQRLTKDWGEGTSEANGNEGSGAASTNGDATWIHTFFDTGTWITAGGDFSSTISASTQVDASSTDYTWSSSQMLDDVLTWLDTPGTNFGWIVRGDENSTANSKRFSSVQSADSANYPRLILNYSVPPRGACCLSDGTCSELSETQCNAAGGTYQGDGVSCESVSCAVELTPYLDPLPIPGVAIPEAGIAGGSAHYRIVIGEHFQQLHSELPPTRVWGYDGSYPAATIEAWRDSLITVQWVNDIRVFETGQLRTVHVLEVDTCLHGPNMTGQVPVVVTHLHGGKVPAGSDGHPEETFAPGDSAELYYYPNIQPSGTLWYHDHALGITRLNVMMGLAGFYLLRDSIELGLGLPSGEYEIPLAIQDKSFNTDGTMQYPDHFEDHFFGDKILVNGKVWPYLNVKQGKYRFRLLNGSNSRAYNLYMSDSSEFTQIGVELGLMETPVLLDSITMLPGERADIIVDFSDYSPGTEIILMNRAPAPFPGFPGVGVIPNVMKFIVQDESGFTAEIPDTLAEVEELKSDDADEERLFELLTISGPECGGQSHPIWTINGLLWDSITEYPVLGSTEIWTWHNETGISHPMHMHLVKFQILDRQALDDATGEPVGPLLEPEPYEKGWKDTAHSPTGYRTRVIARFTGFTGLYAYHCHILEHEDHEMMRQFEVRPCTIVTDTADSGPGSLRYAIDCANVGDTIYFSQDIVGDTIVLLDTLALTKNVTFLNTNGGQITIDGPGINHLFTVALGTEAHMKNLVLISGNGGNGRAIINHGTLTLEDMTVYNSSPAPGSMILNHGLMMIKRNVHFLSLTP